MDRPPLPPFTLETAAQKAQMAEDAWNSRDPARVVLAYTEDSRWRNRAELLQGREAIQAQGKFSGPIEAQRHPHLHDRASQEAAW